MLIGAVARLFSGVLLGNPDRMKEAPTLAARERAERVLQWAFRSEVTKAVKEEKLVSLKPFQKPEDSQVWHTTGRYSRNKLVQALGKSSMVIVIANTRLGQLYLMAAHAEDHKLDVNGILSRTRKRVWLVRGRREARRVARSCLWCRRLGKTTAQQIMGDIPDDNLQMNSPFTVMCLDLFGPMIVKGIGGDKRKQFKAWGVVFSCLSSKAVAIWLAAGYSKDDFLTCFEKQVAVYGLPCKIVSDQGSQLCAASHEVGVWEGLGEELRDLGCIWEFIPAGCPWRNGQAERCVSLAKHTLGQVVQAHEILSFVELEAVLLRVASIINERPLDARLYEDGVFHPISPRDLLLGRVAGYCPEPLQQGEPEEEPQLARRLSKIENLTFAWWKKWEEAAFQLFCPRTKWRREFRNLQEGDIVMLKYDKKLGKPTFRLARVMRTFPDEKGVTRTVELALRSRRGRTREPPTVCRPAVERVTMAVQRLVVILPVEEAWERGLARE